MPEPTTTGKINFTTINAACDVLCEWGGHETKPLLDLLLQVRGWPETKFDVSITEDEDA